jgi:hypothetical protein
LSWRGVLTRQCSSWAAHTGENLFRLVTVLQPSSDLCVLTMNVQGLHHKLTRQCSSWAAHTGALLLWQ